jgi:hypothetical protein
MVSAEKGIGRRNPNGRKSHRFWKNCRGDSFGPGRRRFRSVYMNKRTVIVGFKQIRRLAQILGRLHKNAILAGMSGGFLNG